MNVEKNISLQKIKSLFVAKVNIQINIGRFTIRTISSIDELKVAFALRYQVFQVEMIGSQILSGEDNDEFDEHSDHLAIYDSKSDLMIATCRLNCSLFSNKFYSEQEFNCASLINLPETKLEIGRVCVHRDYRRSIVIMLLWRAIAEYMEKTESRFLFGCGSVATLDSKDAVILYRYLVEEGKVRTKFDIVPSAKYQSASFDRLILDYNRSLTSRERSLAESLLPSLCRSYFDIGCFTPATPAFDRDFKCIDFLTILDINELSPQMRRKMMGGR